MRRPFFSIVWRFTSIKNIAPMATIANYRAVALHKSSQNGLGYLLLSGRTLRLDLQSVIRNELSSEQVDTKWEGVLSNSLN
jgi:hypothetical protein